MNNAGAAGQDTLASSVPGTFDRIIAVNARAPFFVTQAAASRLRDGGRMINISSVYSTRPSKLAPVYSMAKAAVNSMTQTVAAELGERGITVNANAPGWTVTDANAEARKDPALVAQVGKDTVLGRMAEVIVTGAEKVWPVPVEEVLSGHPGIAEVAVWKRPDPEWGERVVAWVVPAGATVPGLDELRELVGGELARWAAPRELVVVDALPRTAGGKLQRSALA